MKANRSYPRLDHFLNESLSEISRSKIERLIKSGNVKLNGRQIFRKNSAIKTGDMAEIEFQVSKEVEYSPSIVFNKLFEDEFIIIIDKPAGISVHPGAGEKQETILDILGFYYPQIFDIDNTDRPGIVHRLDKDTSGILLLAKDFRTQNKLMKQFKRREVKKSYIAIIEKKMRFRNGTINKPIVRSKQQRTKFKTVTSALIEKARESITEYSVLLEFNTSSLLRLTPLTGRTHQLRVHLSGNRTPILGDRLYGNKNRFDRLALHANAIEFKHPIYQTSLRSHSSLPHEFRQYVRTELKLRRESNLDQ